MNTVSALCWVLLTGLALLGAWLFGGALDFYAAHKVSVTCRCGRCRRELTVVDTADALRLRDLLTDDCPTCRSEPRQSWSGRPHDPPQPSAGDPSVPSRLRASVPSGSSLDVTI